jgi:hypothetical protein
MSEEKKESAQETSENKAQSPHDIVDPSLPTEERQAVENDSGGGDADSANAEGGKQDSGSDAPELDDELLARAEEFGISRDDARRLGTADSISRVIDAIERRSAKSAKAETPASSKFNLKIDPDLYDPEFVKALNEMNEHYHAQVEAARSEMRDYLNQQRVEQHFGKLGDEWSELFSGPKGDRNKDKVKVEMQALEAGYKATGRKVPAESELFNRALRGVFGDHTQSLARKQVDNQIRNRQGQFVSRPSQRNGNGIPSRAESVARIAAFMQERGIGASSQEF